MNGSRWFPEPGSRWRLIGIYLLLWAMYAGSSGVIGWLGLPLRHRELLAADVWLFGATPAVAMQGWLPAWGNDALSLGYLGYHFYLHWFLLEALVGDGTWRKMAGDLLLGTFAAGIAGYLIFPAATPEAAFPELFRAPVQGHTLTRWNAHLNAAMAAKYDAFPSLHVLMTLVLLGVDWHHWRWRFWIMLPFTLLMVAATLALRLHYAVDLVAGSVLGFLVILRFYRYARR